jgi:hypothetical protein
LAHAPRPGAPGDRRPEQHRQPRRAHRRRNVHCVTSPDRLDAVRADLQGSRPGTATVTPIAADLSRLAGVESQFEGPVR